MKDKVTSFLQKMKTDIEYLEIAPPSPKLLKTAQTSYKANMNSYRSTSSTHIEKDMKGESSSIVSKISERKTVTRTHKASLSPPIAKNSERGSSNRQNSQTTNSNLSAKKDNLIMSQKKSQLINPEYDDISLEKNGYCAANTRNLDQSFGMNNTQKLLSIRQPSETLFNNNNDEEKEKEKEGYQDQIIISIRMFIVI